MHKPIIGVIPLWDETKDSIWMLPGYFDSLQLVGALPVMLPLHLNEDEAEQMAAVCDGFLLTGGHDVEPEVYGEEKTTLCGVTCPERDSLEKRVFQQAMKENKPVLGVCRGIQLINALMGGTLYQDLPEQMPGAMKEHHMTPPYDRFCHEVAVHEGMLREIVGTDRLGVNSYHHQGIKELAPGLRAEATAPDGLIEAVSCPDKKFVLAVQWHPEFNYQKESSSVNILRAFVESCKK